MFNTADSVPRADISTVLMEAVGQKAHYIAQELLPIYTSATEVGRYPRFRKQAAELLRSARGALTTGVSATYMGSTKRNATGTYNELTDKFEWDQYMTEEYGQEHRVDDKVARQMANFFDAEMIAAERVMQALMLDYEMEVCAAVQNVGSNAGAAADATIRNNNGGSDTNSIPYTNPEVIYTAGNVATMDVPQDFNRMLEYLTLNGTNPEEVSLTLSLTIFNLIRRSTKMQTYVYGFLNVSQGGSMVTADMIAAAFGIQRVLIAKKSVDTAVKGLTPSLTNIWGNGLALMAKTGEGEFQNGGLGRTIVWEADSPGGLFTSESYRDEKRRGTQLRVRSNRVLKIVDPTCAIGLFTGG